MAAVMVVVMEGMGDMEVSMVAVADMQESPVEEVVGDVEVMVIEVGTAVGMVVATDGAAVIGLIGAIMVGHIMMITVFMDHQDLALMCTYK